MRPQHDAPRGISRRLFIGLTAGAAAAPWLQLPRALAALPDTDLDRVTAALPARAPAKPRRSRKLLIFELNVNYGGHPSIPVASAAFEAMGRKTGAFETVISKDPEMFRPETLRQFDAVFFNNNVGNLFTDPALRQSLVDFVYGGGGLMGVHGTSVAFTRWPGGAEDWPEFGLMIGGRGANHRTSDERVVLKLDDPASPVVAAFGGQSVEYHDEFFRVHEPYSRRRLRVLLSMDVEKTGLNLTAADGALFRADHDYGVAWIRQYGRGRTFYCTIAHNPSVFWDSRMLAFYLAATQFVLGDLDAPTAPSARLTPATRALEALNWRVGIAAGAPQQTLFEAIDAAAAADLLYLGAGSTQTVSAGLAKPFDAQLADDERRQIRFKLDEAGVRLLTYRVPELPSDEASCRKLFAFVRNMGVECLIAPPPSSLDPAEKCCNEFDLKLALDLGPKASLDRAQRLCQGRSPRVGIVGDTAGGFDPLKAVPLLKDRVAVLQIGAEHKRARSLLARLRELNLQPAMIGVEPGSNLGDTLKTCREAAERFAK